MTSTALPDPDLSSWVGRENVTFARVDADVVRKFHATFDLPAGDPGPGDKVPRLMHFCLGQPAAATHELGEDGHPRRGGFLPPVDLPRRMWAGGSLAFHDDLRVGDRMRRVSRIADITVKEGRTGVLCFVTVRHEIDVEGRAILTETQDIVYRGSGGGSPGKAAATAATGTHRRPVDPAALLLFRYSALTFNGHRIHYDRRYATQVEGYPGLVVHGPLQATLLLNYAAEIRGSAPARFAFRSLTPLFDTELFHLNAAEDGGKLKLWTARTDGPVAMMAEAEWS